MGERSQGSVAGQGQGLPRPTPSKASPRFSKDQGSKKNHRKTKDHGKTKSNVKIVNQTPTNGIRNKSGGSNSRKTDLVSSLGKAPNGKSLDVPDRANSGKKHSTTPKGKTIPGKKVLGEAAAGKKDQGKKGSKADNGRRKDLKVHVTRTLYLRYHRRGPRTQVTVNPLLYLHAVVDLVSPVKCVRFFWFSSFLMHIPSRFGKTMVVQQHILFHVEVSCFASIPAYILWLWGTN